MKRRPADAALTRSAVSASCPAQREPGDRRARRRQGERLAGERAHVAIAHAIGCAVFREEDACRIGTRDPRRRIVSVDLKTHVAVQARLTRDLESGWIAPSAYSDQPERSFRCDLGNRSSPRERMIGATATSGWSGWFQVVSELIPFFFRIEGPRRATRCALCTRRSQMASAIVGSARVSCQAFVGSCEVMTVEDRS